ncbi:MAG: hypothetical protein LBF37_02965 [Rickettsiales bacterium]|jgi:hypothetical protein|nr:hypothetical protein [Rickettsiales bacterium]
MKALLKKCKWILTGIAAMVMAVGIYFCAHYCFSKDIAMFFEVKCLFAREDANYSLIVDDKKAAQAFKKEMLYAENVNDRADSCQLIKYEHATNQDLFVYSVMTVLKDVTFAFKDEVISENFYQVQYFTSTDEVAALSCNYAGNRFDCYDILPADGQCPDTLENAKKRLMDKCNFNEIKQLKKRV